jgi:hypothetical protein
MLPHLKSPRSPRKARHCKFSAAILHKISSYRLSGENCGSSNSATSRNATVAEVTFVNTWCAIAKRCDASPAANGAHTGTDGRQKGYSTVGRIPLHSDNSSVHEFFSFSHLSRAHIILTNFHLSKPNKTEVREIYYARNLPFKTDGKI